MDRNGSGLTYPHCNPCNHTSFECFDPTISPSATSAWTESSGFGLSASEVGAETSSVPADWVEGLHIRNDILSKLIDVLVCDHCGAYHLLVLENRHSAAGTTISAKFIETIPHDVAEWRKREHYDFRARAAAEHLPRVLANLVKEFLCPEQGKFLPGPKPLMDHFRPKGGYYRQVKGTEAGILLPEFYRATNNDCPLQVQSNNNNNNTSHEFKRSYLLEPMTRSRHLFVMGQSRVVEVAECKCGARRLVLYRFNKAQHSEAMLSVCVDFNFSSESDEDSSDEGEDI